MLEVTVGPLAAGDPVRYAELATALALGTIDANAELLALGISNAGASLLRGFPVSSSASRTSHAPPERAPRRTRSRHWPRYWPWRLSAFRRSEFVLALAACAGVLAFNILYGVLAAVGLSVAELLVRVGRPHDAIQGLVPGLAGMHDIDDYPQAKTIPGLVVYRYDAPLFFANAQDFRRRAIGAAAQASPPARWFILNTEANVEVDFTALEAVEAVRAELTRRGIIVGLARVKQDLLDDLQAFGLAQKLGSPRIFPTLPTAVAAYQEWARRHPEPETDIAA